MFGGVVRAVSRRGCGSVLKAQQQAAARLYSTGTESGAAVTLSKDNDGFATILLNNPKGFNTFSDKAGGFPLACSCLFFFF